MIEHHPTPFVTRRRRTRRQAHPVPLWQRAAIALIASGAVYLVAFHSVRRDYSIFGRASTAQACAVDTAAR